MRYYVFHECAGELPRCSRVTGSVIKFFACGMVTMFFSGGGECDYVFSCVCELHFVIGEGEQFLLF